MHKGKQKMVQLVDIVQWKAPSEIKSLLENQAQMLFHLEANINKRKRDHLNVSLSNLIHKAALEMKRLASVYPESTETLAWCARNLFEINLIIRAIIGSESDLLCWIGQRASDEIDLINGMLDLEDDPSSVHSEILQKRIAEIKDICKRHGIVPAKPFKIIDLAKRFNLEKEYRALYKLFSKYVHPSAWQINGDQQALTSTEALNIFIVYAQIYSGDLFNRVCTKLEIGV